MLRGTVWESNFEPFFDAEDNSIHETIKALQELKGFGSTPTEFVSMLWSILRRDVGAKKLTKAHAFDEQSHRDLVRLVFSLLIRSPSSRRQRENYIKWMRPDAEPNEETGKANMSQDYRIAKDLWESGPISTQTFILLHSPYRKFITGDGYFDALTPNLVAGRIDGRALVPLTPSLGVYFCTPNPKIGMNNMIALTVPAWMVDKINSRTQVYSKEQLFFVGKPPKIEEAFKRNEFLNYSQYRDEILDILDEVAGWDRTSYDQISSVLS